MTTEIGREQYVCSSRNNCKDSSCAHRKPHEPHEECDVSVIRCNLVDGPVLCIKESMENNSYYRAKLKLGPVKTTTTITTAKKLPNDIYEINI